MDPPFQWQVVRADLDPARGSEQAGRRPVLVVSHESCNLLLPVVTVLPITTHRAGQRVYWNEVLIPAGQAGLPSDSIVMALQIRTISKDRMQHSYGWLTDARLR